MSFEFDRESPGKFDSRTLNINVSMIPITINIAMIPITINIHILPITININLRNSDYYYFR